MVLLDLFDPPVDTQAMALMDHIVSHGQLGKAADLLALVIVLFPLLLAALVSEHVAFRNDHKFDQRIFKALMELSIGHQDLPRVHRTAGILGTEGPQIVLSQIPCQTAGPGPGRRKEHHPVALLFPAGQVLDQKLKAVLVGIDIFSRDTVFLLNGHARKPLVQARHENGLRRLGRRQHGLCGK